jgi:hypothetical protein
MKASELVMQPNQKGKQMIDSSASGDNNSEQQALAGIPVLASDGTQIGVVSKQGIQGDVLFVKKGRVFPEEFSVPVASIAQQNDTVILLNLSKSELGIR